ncbi:sensor domain-containing diguanylate cyclase [Rhabdonatronobacter sediminivivens]|nr:sensor domain-containing diguanylate cyclase [Rhabdonatronobacter sediminivivens]
MRPAPKPRLIGAPDPAPKWIPAPAQFDNLRGLIRSVLSVSSVSISFDASDLIRTSGVQRGFISVPLMRDDTLIGALRVLDSADRMFTQREQTLLQGFAALIVEQFELWQQASRDPLTGAMTRRVFETDLRKAIAASRRSGEDLSLILFDLDHFKRINDTLGHCVGDRVLQEVGRVAAQQLRVYDTFGRLGGEEFGILLAVSMPEALDVAERVRAAIEVTAFPGHETLKVTASFGVAAVGESLASADALLRTADAQLYGAKQAGRNRVHADDAMAPHLTVVR